MKLINDGAVGRYRLLLDDAEVGYVEYDRVRERSILIKAHRGPARTRGQGLRAAARALDDIRSQTKTVIPILPLCDELCSSPQGIPRRRAGRHARLAVVRTSRVTA
ncbi:MAG: hypothetical protein ACREX9_19920 [Gammaproteobacteria bacterium]